LRSRAREAAIVLIGSTEVGKLIVTAAAGNLKKVSLELGGKSPTIVFGDADIESAIPGAASAIFFNHGQCCCAGSRLYAHKKVFDQVVEGVATAAKKIKVGPGLDPKTDMGPLVSEEQFQRVTGFLKSGVEEGAKVVTGGNKAGSNGGYFVEPTVLTNTTPSMKVVKEEIFGPVVCAEPFDDADLERVAKTANNTVYGLAASVWTKDISKAHKLAALIRSGTVWINCHNVFDDLSAVRRLQAVGLGPRDGRRSAGELHRGQGDHGQALISVVSAERGPIVRAPCFLPAAFAMVPRSARARTRRRCCRAWAAPASFSPPSPTPRP
jgi:phenylacetaldehyde dehydrogenase